MSHDPNCIFCKIARGEVPAKKLYEDEKVFAVNDINPLAPVHILIVPHLHIPTLLDLPDNEFDLIGQVFRVAAQLAKERGVAAQGFKVFHNVNEWGGQRVFHMHFHLVGGKKFHE